MKRTYNKLKSGNVAFILVVGMLFGAMVVINYLGMNTVFVKRAANELQTVLDNACKSASVYAATPTRAKTEFEAVFAELRYSKIVQAQFILPAMPETSTVNDGYVVGVSSIAPNITNAACSTSGIVSSANVGDLNIVDALGVGEKKWYSGVCPMPKMLRPVIVGKSVKPDVYNIYGANFPPSLFEPYYNAGNTVGCYARAELPYLLRMLGEVAGEIDTIGNGYVSAKAVYQHRMRNQKYGTIQAGLPELYKPIEGLTVAVAPVLNITEELRGDLGQGINYYSYAKNTNSAEFMAGSDSNDFEFSSNGNAIIASINETDSSGDINEKKSDFYLSCVNNLTVARNQLTSTILRFASLDGQLRRSTEFLLVNSGTDLPTAMIRMQTPTNISNTSLGDDIAKQNFQIPFIPVRDSSSQLLSPFTNNNGLNDEGTTLFYNRTMVSQLRDCYQYLGSTALAVGQDQNQIIEPESSATLDSKYSDPLSKFKWTKHFRESGYTPVSNPKEQTYDQDCFNSSGCGASSRMLSSWELAGAIGSIQSCPYEVKNGSNVKCNKDETNIIPLYPNLEGTLNFWRNGGPIIDSQVFDVDATNNTTLSTVALRSNAYTRDIDSIKKPALFMVFHELTKPMLEIIHAFINNNKQAFLNRPAIFVYMPTNMNPMSSFPPLTFQEFEDAFYPDPSGSIEKAREYRHSTGIYFYALYPDSPHNTSSENKNLLLAGCANKSTLGDYWQCLRTRDVNPNLSPMEELGQVIYINELKQVFRRL